MHRKLACLLSGVFFVTWTGCATPRKPALVESADLASAGYQEYWNAQLPFQKGERVRDAFLVDENLYVTSTLGHFYTVEAQQGLLRWNTPLTKPEYTVHRPTHLRSAQGLGPACVVTTTRTYLFDRYTGDVIEAFTPDFPPGSAAIGDETRLYMGGADGMMHCLSWKHPFGRKPLRRWDLLAGGPVLATPSFFGPDKLIFASQGGQITSCYAFDKAYEWRSRTEDAIIADPYVDESGVYVACADRSLYKFEPDNGSLNWRHRFPKPLSTPPVVHRGVVYQYCEATGLSAIDAASGDEKWVRADGLSFVAGRPQEAVILTDRGTVERVNQDTGDTVHDLGASGVTQAVPNTVDDRVILLADGGQIVCARPDSSPYLRRQQVLAARDRLQSAPQSVPEPPPPPPAPTTKSRDPFRSERDK